MADFEVTGKDMANNARGEYVVVDELVARIADGGEPTTGATAYLQSLAKEVIGHRAAQAADKERIKAAVAHAFNTELVERKLYLVKPQRPTMSEIALETYGHGRACDAVALLDDELKAQIDAIATRAAEQLATAAVRLSAEEVDAIVNWRKVAIYDRLDHRSAIDAIDRLIAAHRSQP